MSGTCTTCGASGVDPATQSCRVNVAIDQLYAQTPRIQTFVVGFQLSGSSNLNCNAVHGHTVNSAVPGCDTLTTSTCDDVGAPTCYYDATDATALQNALDDVIQQVSSCRFSVVGVPQDMSKIFVYLEDSGNPADRQEILRFTDWDYYPSSNQIEFFGVSCSQVKGGAKQPLVVFGCPIVGG